MCLSRETLRILRFVWPSWPPSRRRQSAIRCLFLTLANFNGHQVSKHKLDEVVGSIQ